MAFDISEVEPLGSKSVLLEQALKRHQQNRQTEIDMTDMISPDYEWLKDDKVAIQDLVREMDHSISDLANKMGDVERLSDRSRLKIEKEQQLLFKQIKTLNGLLKKQINIFSSVERQIEDIELQQNNILPQIGVGLVAGLMSAVTILATAPWVTILMEHLRASM